MDVSTKLICDDCKKEVLELKICLPVDMKIVWSDIENEYLVVSGNFDLKDVHNWFCPHCSRLHILNDEYLDQVIAIPDETNWNKRTKQALKRFYTYLIDSFKSKKKIRPP